MCPAFVSLYFRRISKVMVNHIWRFLNAECVNARFERLLPVQTRNDSARFVRVFRQLLGSATLCANVFSEPNMNAWVRDRGLRRRRRRPVDVDIVPNVPNLDPLRKI